MYLFFLIVLFLVSWFLRLNYFSIAVEDCSIAASSTCTFRLASSAYTLRCLISTKFDNQLKDEFFSHFLVYNI